MSDPILLFLVMDIVALLGLGMCVTLLPVRPSGLVTGGLVTTGLAPTELGTTGLARTGLGTTGLGTTGLGTTGLAPTGVGTTGVGTTGLATAGLVTAGLVTAGLGGFGALLCLVALSARLPATILTIPVGPPGLSLHLALDPLSASFLFLGFLAGTAVAAFQASAVALVSPAQVRLTALCLAGTGLTLIAGDGVTLTIGMAVVCGAMSLPDRRGRTLLLIPLLVLAAVCLLTPADFAPRFDTIRAAPINVGRAAAAAALIIASATGLIWGGLGARCWTRAAVTAGLGIPAAIYLLVRMIADLSAAAAQSWSGTLLMLAGGSIAVVQGWRATADPDIDRSITHLVRRQGGLAMTGVGLALMCRAEDLPAAASFAFAAAFLLAIGGSIAGTAASIAAGVIGESAGTYRLSGLGGLVHSMPGMSAGLAACLFALSALPPGLGFAGLWLLLEAILSAPRTGGVLAQLPLALTAGAIALSAALTTAASVRMAGIALLGRPRSPSGAGAAEGSSRVNVMVWAPAGLAPKP